MGKNSTKFISCIVVTDFPIMVLLQVYVLQTQGFWYISLCDDLIQKRKEKNLYSIYNYIHCIFNYITDRVEILFWVCIHKKKSFAYTFKCFLIGRSYHRLISNFVFFKPCALALAKYFRRYKTYSYKDRSSGLNFVLQNRMSWQNEIEISLEAIPRQDTEA